MKEGQELVEAPETVIQPFVEFEAEIVEFEEMNSKMKFDLTTEKGVEECEAYLLLLRKVEIRIDKKRKTKGTSLRKAVTDLNASAKIWHDRVHTMYEVHDEPLAKVRQAILDAAIDKAEAEKAEAQAIEDKRLADLQEREDAAKAKEAELKEKEDALNADQIKKDLEDAKLAAAQKAIDDERATVTAENNRLAEVEKARQANVEHCKKYNNLALDAINALIDDPATSLRLVKAIVKGEIPNVTMNY